MQEILLLNGPNLQLLGSREPDIYGKTTLASIVADVIELGKKFDLDVKAFQSNSEGDLVTIIGDAPRNGFSGIIINPAAYTHTSVAIRDAIAAAGISPPVSTKSPIEISSSTHSSMKRWSIPS